jgi:mannose-1-phosphate guanylyltransferase
MAGGSGERFWPLSRQNRPKQLLKLSSATNTLLEEALDRVASVIDPAHIYIATARHLQGVIREANTGVPDENILGEPCKRNTSGCLAFVTAHLLARYGGDGYNLTMAVLTADHVIGEPKRFQKAIQAAMDVAEYKDALVTIGIVPTRAETGYGYIELAEKSQVADGGAAKYPFYTVARFREKPSRETADEFLETGRFLWNSGMFFWRIAIFLAELQQTQPSLARAITAMKEAILAGEDHKVESIFESLNDVSIDYALLEKARHVVVTRAEFPWDDIGAWDALDRIRPRDDRGNITIGDPIVVDSHDCIIVNEPGAEELAVSVIGVEDLAIVVSPDAVLVVRKDRAQDVRRAVAELKRRAARQL